MYKRCFYAIILLSVFFWVSLFPISASETISIKFSELANVLPWGESTCALNEAGVKLHTCKEKIYPSERYLDILVKLEASATDIKGTNLSASIYSNRELSRPLAQTEMPVTAPNSIVSVDMRQLKEDKVRIRVEWKDRRKNLLGSSVMLISADPVKTLSADTKIPLTIDVPDGAEAVQNYPVRFGVPFPEGAVWATDNLILVNSEGKELPSQFEIASRWAREGAIKWLLIDSLVSGKNGDKIYLQLGKRSVKSNPSIPLTIKRESNSFSINTGVAQYIVGTDGALIKEARVNRQVVAREGQTKGLYVIDQKRRLAKASSKDASVKVEADGPVSTVIRIEGNYTTADGEDLARHITRLEFNAGRPEVSVTHTLILTRDTNQIWFKDIGWEFEVSPGQEAEALFSYSSEQPKEVVSIPLDKGKKVNLLQREGINLGVKPLAVGYWNRPKPRLIPRCHFRGKNIFELSETGKEKVVYKDHTMGDCAGVSGKISGWIVSCINTAAQHPKEFELSESRLDFKMFSSSSGKELDFRMESVMKNWGMLPKEEAEEYKEVTPKVFNEFLEHTLKHTSNAAGWSKTHDILFTPFSTKEVLATTSLLHSKQVFVHNSPQWIRETEVIGPIHPKDTERFPDEERVIEGLFNNLYQEWGCGPLGGYIDYHSGPNRLVYDIRTGGYSFREESWYLYMRSGERALREFAQGANRAYMDNNISHWNVPNKELGLILGKDPQKPGLLKSDLPMHWQGIGKRYEISTAVNFNQMLHDYYISGYRRSSDIISNFSNAAKNILTYEDKHWRVLLAIRHLAEVYEFTREPRLRELIYEINNRNIYDPEGKLLLAKEKRPYKSSTYKTETDQDVLLLLWNTFKDPLFKKMGLLLGQNNLEKNSFLIGIEKPENQKVGANRSTGLLYHFLWEETKDPLIVSDFDYGRRVLVSAIYKNPVTKEVNLICTSQIPKVFRGLPISMDILLKSDTEENPLSTLLAFTVEESPIRVFFIKPGNDIEKYNLPVSKDETSITLFIRKERSGSAKVLASKSKDFVPKPATAGGNIVVQPHTLYNNLIWSGHDLHTVTEQSDHTSKVMVPKDAPSGLYELLINTPGKYTIFSDRYTPLVLYAPEGWIPPKMVPPVKIGFRLPEGVKDGKISFEKDVNLFTPDGKPFNKGEAVGGLIELSAEKPGVWIFESIDSGKVKGYNIPPFFSMGNIGLYTQKPKEKVSPLERVKGSLSLPSTWRVFGPMLKEDPVLSSKELNSYPEKIKIGKKEYNGTDIKVENNIYDFPNILKDKEVGSVAYTFIKFHSDKNQLLTLGMGADWWMQAWVNGKLVHDTTETSNIHFPFSIWNHPVNVRVVKGENILAVRFIRGGTSQLALGGPNQLKDTPPPPSKEDKQSKVEEQFKLFLTD